VEGVGPGGPVSSLFADLGLEHQIKVTVPHAIAMPPIVMNTDLVMTTTRGVAEIFGKLGGLRWLPVPHRMPPVHISLYWHEKKHRDAANKWLRTFIRSSIAAPASGEQA
jgi:DNA-binding transcriptional LysR family regulator